MPRREVEKQDERGTVAHKIKGALPNQSPLGKLGCLHKAPPPWGEGAGDFCTKIILQWLRSPPQGVC